MFGDGNTLDAVRQVRYESMSAGCRGVDSCFCQKMPQVWFNIQIETLKRVHSSWLPGVPIDLLTQARKLALGRRGWRNGCPR